MRNKTVYVYIHKIHTGPVPIKISINNPFPVTVVFFFSEGWLSGYCLNSKGQDQNSGLVTQGQSTPQQCLAACKKDAYVTVNAAKIAPASQVFSNIMLKK